MNDLKVSELANDMIRYYVHLCFLICLQFFCVVIAAYTTEIRFGYTTSAQAAYGVCVANPEAATSGIRVCHSLLGVAISSILVCMVLMIFDVFIPCVDKKVMVIINIIVMCL